VPTISSDNFGPSRLSDHDAAPRLKAILDATVDAIITIDVHGTIESVNPATERMFGYSAAQMLGNNVAMLMAAPHREQHDGYLQHYLATGERRIIGIGREVDARRADGSLFPVDLAVTEFWCDEQRMFTGLIRDISERRAAERAAQQRLDELAHAGRLAELGLTTSTIAHEVNQPLTAIVSFAHACQRLLDQGAPDRDLLRDALGQIAQQGERASAIISHIRAMSSKRETLTERVDLNATVRGVLDILARELRYQQVDVRTCLDDAVPAVRADRVQVEQIIMNLLSNAMDAMRADGPHAHCITITSALECTSVSLTVQDNGPGLDATQLARVFENFYTTKPSGLGLGLSICRSLARAHGGELRAQDPAPGERGAAFLLSLPVDV
jgi:two-component system sensor kinase FixL